MNNQIKSVLVLIAVLLMSACGSVESDLTGVWIHEAEKDINPEQRTESFEFFSDNTMTLKNKPRHVVITQQGTWTVLDDGRIKIDIDVPFTTLVLMGSLDGAKLTLKNDMMPADAILVKQ